jgi:hypothetical protein
VSNGGGGRLDQRVGATIKSEAKASREREEGEQRRGVRGAIDRRGGEHERSEANREKASPFERGRPGAQERAERESFSAASQEAAAARATEAAAAEANRAKGAAKGAAARAEGARAMRLP